MFVKIALDNEINDKAGAPLVVKLKTNLEQSSAEPEKLVQHDRREARRHPLKSDSCVYIYEDETGFVILTLYVDDILPQRQQVPAQQTKKTADRRVRDVRYGQRAENPRHEHHPPPR